MHLKPDSNKADQISTTTCAYDCGSRCLLKVHLRDKKIVHISSSNREGHYLQACPRGLAQASAVNHPDRLMFPLKRVGDRGKGKFKSISWDEALTIISEKIPQTIAHFGTESLYFVTNTGSMATLHNTARVAQRFFGLLGKCTTTWGNPSYEGALQSALATFGMAATGSTRNNLFSSKLIVLWGWNPLATRFGPDTIPVLARVKKKGAKIICVDPRQSQTCQALADEWVPVRPGTDTALAAAMTYVMISEDRLDWSFIDKHTYGFDTYRDYVIGAVDGVPKTPQWAHPICGTPVEAIINLARQYASHKPAALIAGWAPGRTAYGEQFHRAASILSAITGNMGIDGGHTAGGPDYVDMGFIEGNLPKPETRHHELHFSGLYDAILNPKPVDNHPRCKLLYIVGCNLLNQNLNLNKGIEALAKVDFIVTHELFLTPTAMHADIVLPVSHFFEREDIGQPFIGGPYCIHMQKIIDAPPTVKSDLEIFSEIAGRIDLDDFNSLSDEKWLQSFLDSEPGFPDLETFRAVGVHTLDLARPHVAFQQEIQNPDKHPFPTPSGKIEIFSHRFADMNNPSIPPIPIFLAPWEGPEDPLAPKYPIQLVSPHSKARANSTLNNVKTIKGQGDDNLWISVTDAHRRNIQDGDTVQVYNQRGRIRTTAKVTSRIMPGVASLDQGQWYAPDDHGIDTGSCVNVLTTDKKSPVGAFPCNTCLIEIEKCSD